MFKKLLLSLLVLAVGPASADFVLTARKSSNGEINLLYPAGNSPVASGVISGYTTRTIGTADCQFSTESSGTVQVIEAIARVDAESKCAITKQVDSASDLHLEAEFLSMSGIATYSGGGVSIAEGIASTDYAASTVYFYGPQSVSIKATESGSNIGAVGGTAVAGTLPLYLQVEYDLSPSTQISGGTGSNGTAWTQAGTAHTKALTFPVQLTLWCASYTTPPSGASNTCRFGSVANSTTLEGGTPPVTPPDEDDDTPLMTNWRDGTTFDTTNRTRTASDNSTFNDYISDAELVCGDTIIVGATTLTSAKTINGYQNTSGTNCPVNEPIRIIGAGGIGTPNWTSDATGPWTLRGNVIVVGIEFRDGGRIANMTGTGPEVIQSKFTNWGANNVKSLNAINVDGRAVVAGSTGAAQYPVTAFNEISFPGDWIPIGGTDTTPNPDVTLTGNCSSGQYLSYEQFRMGYKAWVNSTSSSYPMFGWVLRNYIHDFPEKPCPGSSSGNYNSGQNDAIELGVSNERPAILQNSNYRIEYNLIARHDQWGGGTPIDIKYSYVTLRGNTILEGNVGLIQQRDGINGRIISNYIRQGQNPAAQVGGGITIQSQGHWVCGNDTASGAGIYVNAGIQAHDGEEATQQAASEAVKIMSNRANARIGHQYNSNYDNAANGTIIQDTIAGTIALGNSTQTYGSGQDNMYATNTTNTPGAAADYTCPMAVSLTTAQVGPDALNTYAPPNFLSVRGLD